MQEHKSQRIDNHAEYVAELYYPCVSKAHRFLSRLLSHNIMSDLNGPDTT